MDWSPEEVEGLNVLETAPLKDEFGDDLVEDTTEIPNQNSNPRSTINPTLDRKQTTLYGIQAVKKSSSNSNRISATTIRPIPAPNTFGISGLRRSWLVDDSLILGSSMCLCSVAFVVTLGAENVFGQGQPEEGTVERVLDMLFWNY